MQSSLLQRKFHRADIAVMTFVTLLSCAFAGYLFGTVRVDPTSTLWLADGDVAQHFLGWHFYRGEPWGVPLGTNSRYGLEMGSSIVFTDSIPLLAIAFKALRALLPDHFQYAGPWMLFCFVAQGLAGYLLLRRFTAQRIPLFCGSLFFVLSPVLVSRTMGHFALVGQWTLLLSLYLYFLPSSSTLRRWSWRGLLVTTALIHGYLLYFVLAIWFAAALRDRDSDKTQTKSLLVNMCTTFAVLITSMWLAGWFDVPFGSAAFGTTYGQYAANLAALVNPPWGSPILPTIASASTASGLESINYLGAGILALAATACIAVRDLSGAYALIRKHRWLALATLGFALLAFSHNVYWGETLVAHIPVPEGIRKKLEFVRGSGRLLWLAHYLIILAAVVIVARRLPARTASIAILVAFSVQIYDLWPSYKGFADHQARTAFNSVEKSKATALKSSFWAQAATRYTEIDFFPITHAPPRYEPIALWAGDHHLAINAAYFGRISVSRSFARNAQLEKELTLGSRRLDTLYILQNKSDLNRVLLAGSDGIGELDGYLVVAPGWFDSPSSPSPVDGLHQGNPTASDKIAVHR